MSVALVRRIEFRPELERVKPNAGKPFSDQPGILSGGQMLRLAVARRSTSDGIYVGDIPREIRRRRPARRTAGQLYLGQLRGRTLPVAASRFAEQLATALTRNFGEVEVK